MISIRILKDALKNLRKNKTRSLLTALGIIIGVTAVIVMVGIGKGAQADIETQIKGLGTNLIMVMPGFGFAGGVNQGAGSQNRLNLDDVADISKRTKFVGAISPIVNSNGQIIGGGNNWSSTVFGVSTEYIKIRSWSLASGEFFDEKAVSSRKKVAVIGKTVAENLFGDADPVGERIRIRNTPFTVIGVLAKKGTDARGQDQDDVILAPVTTVLYRLKGGSNINQIIVSATTEQTVDSAKNEITAILRERHKLQPDQDNDFRIMTQIEIATFASSTAKTMTMLLTAIALVSLLVGGIGIMNIMLVTVTERTREIGIRMALGARSIDILLQFLAESIVLSLIGGFVGILFAIALIFAVKHFMSLSAVVNPLIVLLSVVFSGSVGVFFGYYPAHKASKLNPIDALRYE
jgi:putative ABC transport system permease protein